MINDNTILSSFDDKPTLLEWLKKVEEALKTDTAKSISVVNPEPNTYVFKITFADGTTLSSGNVVFPNAVQDVSIKNGHIIVTQISGTQTDLGAINPYADTIVLNAETNTTEIGNNLRVNGTITADGKELSAVVANPTEETTETLSKVKIGNTAYAVGGGGTQWYKHNVSIANPSMPAMSIGIEFYSMFGESLKEIQLPNGIYVAIMTSAGGPSAPNADTAFPVLNVSGANFMLKYLGTDGSIQRYQFDKSTINSDEVTAV